MHSYLAPVIAYMTAVGMARRPRWRVLLWAVLLLNAFAVLVPGYTTPFSIVVTVLIGWTVAYGTLYAVGTPNVAPDRPDPARRAAARRLQARSARMRVEDPARPYERRPASDRGRRYRVTLEDGPPLDVTVVDREQQAQGFFYRVWRRLTLRGHHPAPQPPVAAPGAGAGGAAGVRGDRRGSQRPRLIATSELGPDAVMLVYEHIGGPHPRRPPGRGDHRRR